MCFVSVCLCVCLFVLSVLCSGTNLLARVVEVCQPGTTTATKLTLHRHVEFSITAVAEHMPALYPDHSSDLKQQDWKNDT